MICHFRSYPLCFIFLALQLATSMAQSKPTEAPAAPVPAQILSAKKVFIANAGGDEMALGDPIFTGGPDRAYNQFYAAVKNWGRLEVAGSPAEADLVLEIRQATQTVTLGGKAGGSATPLFQLKLVDPKTNLLLWAFHIHGEFGYGQANSDKNFDQAVNRLVLRFQTLIAQGSPSDAAKP
jgi:hypothetical protein